MPRIFEAVFECTLTMITKNFEVSFPECKILCIDRKADVPSLDMLQAQISCNEDFLRKGLASAIKGNIALLGGRKHERNAVDVLFVCRALYT